MRKEWSILAVKQDKRQYSHVPERARTRKRRATCAILTDGNAAPGFSLLEANDFKPRNQLSFTKDRWRSQPRLRHFSYLVEKLRWLEAMFYPPRRSAYKNKRETRNAQSFTVSPEFFV